MVQRILLVPNRFTISGSRWSKKALCFVSSVAIAFISSGLSSKPKTSKFSMSSGSVTARVETWPGKSSLCFLRARSLGAIIDLLFICPTLWSPAHFNSELDHDLDRLALVHRAVAIRHTVKVRDPVDHAARLYPPFEHVGQYVLDIGANRGRA